MARSTFARDSIHAKVRSVTLPTFTGVTSRLCKMKESTIFSTDLAGIYPLIRYRRSFCISRVRPFFRFLLVQPEVDRKSVSNVDLFPTVLIHYHENFRFIDVLLLLLLLLILFLDRAFRRAVRDHHDLIK